MHGGSTRSMSGGKYGREWKYKIATNAQKLSNRQHKRTYLSLTNMSHEKNSHEKPKKARARSLSYCWIS
jgi:hypothetical protein